MPLTSASLGTDEKCADILMGFALQRRLCVCVCVWLLWGLFLCLQLLEEQLCILAWLSLALSYVGVTQILEYVDLCLLQNLRTFQLSFDVFFLATPVTFFLLSWNFSNMNVRPFVTVTQVPKVLFSLKKIFQLW